MSYSFSFDASLKLKPSSNIKGFLNHFARELDTGFTNHSNENIDPSRTNRNITLIYNAKVKHMVKATCQQQVEDALQFRLEDAINFEDGTYRSTGKKVREDACLAFGLILQLDPQFYKDNKSDNKAINKSFNDLLDLAKEAYGEENIVAASLHLDETNPHLHLLMTPVTKDSRLNQKEFINGPKLKLTHRKMREEMKSRGYDIDMERRTPVGAKRLSEEDYKGMKRLEDRISQNKAQIEEQEDNLKKITLETEKRLKMANTSSEDYLKYQTNWMKTHGYSEQCLNDYFQARGLNDDFSSSGSDYGYSL